MRTKNAFIIIAIMAIVIAGLSKTVINQQKENKRLDGNQTALLEDVKYYRTKDSLSAASVQALTLKNREFKKFEKELLETIDDLNLEVKRLQSTSQTATKTEYQVKTEIRDSLIYLEGKEVVLKCVEFDNEWLTISGCVENGQFDGIIQSRDTIEQFIHRVPRKFLFIKWGTKAIRQEVISKNPYSEIVFSKYIELK